MVGTNYNGGYQTLLYVHTKYRSSGPCGFREEEYFSFPMVSLWEIDAPGARSILTPGAKLAQFIIGTTKHCYIQNIEALGLLRRFFQ